MSRRLSSINRILLTFLLTLAVFVNHARPCTAFVMKGSGAILLAKNFDWPIGEGYLFINKRNIVKEAFGGDPALPLRWTSKYGSVTFNQFGREFPLGGINEAGLVVEELNAQSQYPAPDKRPSVNEFQWIQYQLDNCCSVKEVLKSDTKLRISKLVAGLHYLVADRKGNAAVIEFIEGKMVSYSGADLPVPVLSNNSYAESLRYLKFHKGFGGERIVSSGPESGERFVRAATLLDGYYLPGQRSIVDEAFSVLKSVAQNDTKWSIVYSIRLRRIFFKTKSHRQFKVINLKAFDFSCKSPVLMLPVDTDAVWDLTKNFFAYDALKNRLLLDSVFRKLREIGELDSVSPELMAEKMARYPETCRCR